MITASAIVFDLDGTLFDHATSARRGLRAWLASAGVESTSDLEAAWFAAEAKHFRSWRDGVVTWSEQRRLRLREFLPLIGDTAGSDDDLDAAFEDGYLAAYQRSWVGFDDVDEGLSELAALGFPFAVLTNGSEQQQRDKLAHLGLQDRLGPLFTAEKLGVAKPKPQAFHAVCSALGLPPHEVLYVGDEYETDVEASRAAGLQAIHLDRTGPRSSPSDDRVETLAELARVVTRGDLR
ncbi:haloacid dehalogenase [Frondihabitans sucicola]|uniref:Haloacid dehalogenase n=1 Tax=Frondihabitans sucicola TaxID=1268041 RepID=A0ABM8GP62_9MICO|nr:HAD family hydrolase [Frondihabitans sucicola]BDZ50233.1 haloacid dehalogenase [Frondihabitans sucicola]